MSDQFTFTQVATVARISTGTLTQWARRGKIVMRAEDRADTGKGNARYLSYNTMVQVVLTAEMSRRGIGLDTASEVASFFAHTGCAKRNPSQVFAGGHTWIALNDFGPIKHRLFAADLAESFANLLGKIYALSERDYGFTLICVSEIMLSVHRALHLDYAAILDRIYQEGPADEDDVGELVGS